MVNNNLYNIDIDDEQKPSAPHISLIANTQQQQNLINLQRQALPPQQQQQQLYPQFPPLQQPPQPQQQQLVVQNKTQESVVLPRTGKILIDRKYTPLLSAIYDVEDFASISNIIRAHPEHINTPEPSNNYTPILLASEIDNDDISLALITLLVTHGASTKVLSKNGFTPFCQAACFGNIKTLQYLVSLGEDPAQPHSPVPPILLAAEKGHLEVVNYLISLRAPVNAALFKPTSTNPGVQALHQACINGHLDIVRTLVEHGADIENCTNNSGCTPLYLAIEQNHIDVAKYLISKGCNVNTRRADGFFGLYLAAQKGQTEMVRLVLKKGGDATMKSKGGSTALDIATKHNHTHIITLLRSYKRIYSVTQYQPLDSKLKSISLN